MQLKSAVNTRESIKVLGLLEMVIIKEDEGLVTMTEILVAPLKS